MSSNIVFGRNAIIELIKSERKIHQILISRASKFDARMQDIIKFLEANNVQFRYVDKKELDRRSKKETHQGILAITQPRKYVEVEDILEEAKKLNEQPFILILDGIEDPHNFGSLIRSAVGAGVHGIIIPNKKQADISPTVIKSSAGAAEHILIAKVSNTVQSAEYLKKQNIWIMGAHHYSATDYTEVNYKDGLALVIGNEGSGISKLMLKTCDYSLKIPISPKVESLNASVAGALLLFQIKKSR